MEIVRICGNDKVLGDVGIVVRCAAGHFHHLAKELGLLHGLLGPHARIQVGSLLLQEIVGNTAEFRAGTACQENHLIACRHVQQFLGEGNCLVHHGLEILCAMAYLHQTQACTIEFQTGCCRCFNHFAGQYAGARIKIIHFHNVTKFNRIFNKF